MKQPGITEILAEYKKHMPITCAYYSFTAKIKLKLSAFFYKLSCYFGEC